MKCVSASAGSAARAFQGPLRDREAEAAVRPARLCPESTLVALSEQGAGPPLFLMPHGGMRGTSYRSLVRWLRADRPVYAFEPRDAEGRMQAGVSLGEQVDSYLEMVRRIQPRGPYYLGGLSGGGLIAWETAVRLSERGEKVGWVVMFDTYARSYLRVRPLPQRGLLVVAWYLRHLVLLDVLKPHWYKQFHYRKGQLDAVLAHNTARDLVVKIVRRLSAAGVRLLSPRQPEAALPASEPTDDRGIRQQYSLNLLEERLREAERVTSLVPGPFKWLDRLALRLLKRAFPFFARVYARSCTAAALEKLSADYPSRVPAGVSILQAYSPPTWDGDVLLFRARRQPPGMVEDPTLGWCDFARGRLDVVDVDGEHTSIIRSRFAAERLQEYLDRHPPEARCPAP